MRLLRLSLRIVLPAGLTVACVVWMVCQCSFIIVRMPLPAGNLHLRADHEGWILQLAETQATPRLDFEFHPRQRSTGDWCEWLRDLNPYWLGSSCVCAHWQISNSAVTSRYQLFGVKHYVVVSIWAMAVCMLIRNDWRQKRKVAPAD